MRKKIFSTFALVLCASTAMGALNLISVNDEIAIGRKAQQQVRQQVPELRDGTVNNYIDRLGRAVAGRADGPRYPYSIDVANYREVNAFALPGGPIWIHRGTIDAAQTESQLVGVIAHEVAHIANRHAAEQISKGTVANVGRSVLFGLAHAVVGIPIGGQTGGGFRPYLSGGAGLLQTNVQSDDDLFEVTNDEFGINVGAGAMGFMTDNVGFRGDLRYYRALTDPEADNEFDIDFGDFDFWRATVGVTFRFGS